MAEGLAILLKAAFYAGSLTAVGIGVHIAIGMPLPSRSLRIAALALGLALALRLLSLNAEIAGGWGQVLDTSMFNWVWPSVRAQVIALSLGLIGLCAASMTRPRIFAGVGAIAVAAGFGLAGHTQVLEGAGLAYVAVGVHVLIAGFWVLAPIVLWPRVGIEINSLTWRMERFSRVAVWAVPIMIALGLWLAVEIAGSIINVFQTPYGRLLLLKLGVASLALSIGALNKVYVTARLKTGGLQAFNALRLALMADVVLFTVAIFAIAAATTVFGPH
jgi:putative copper export protein